MINIQITGIVWFAHNLTADTLHCSTSYVCSRLCVYCILLKEVVVLALCAVLKCQYIMSWWLKFCAVPYSW